jgi:hypothetical protein
VAIDDVPVIKVAPICWISPSLDYN